MAGVAGLEPAHARIKTLCLTNLATPQSLKFIVTSNDRPCGAAILTRPTVDHHACVSERGMNSF